MLKYNITIIDNINDTIKEILKIINISFLFKELRLFSNIVITYAKNIFILKMIAAIIIINYNTKIISFYLISKFILKYLTHLKYFKIY